MCLIYDPVMLRWMEMMLPTPWMDKALSMLEEEPVTVVYHGELDSHLSVIRAILPGEGNEVLLDRLEKAFSFGEGFRLVLMPVSACIPRVEHTDKRTIEKIHGEPTTSSPSKSAPVTTPEIATHTSTSPRRHTDRIYREEMYEQISDMASGSRYFLATALLSAVVAGIGIIRGNLPVIIGAMVIAPLLGPNVALAFSVTLADEKLGWKATKTLLSGIISVLVIAVIWGMLLPVDPAWPEVAARTSVTPGDIVLALAAGSAGVLSITAGISSTLVGVMVAVALLPPLVTCGLLAGSLKWEAARGAALVFLINVICINLSGVLTFVVEGIRPNSWLETHRARRSTIIAVISWLLLLILVAILVLAPSGRISTLIKNVLR